MAIDADDEDLGGGLPILDGEDLEEMEEDEATLGEGPRTILITGANGNIGRKLRAAWDEEYDLVLIDRFEDPEDDDVIAADLANFEEEWMSMFHGVDTVVHLAADPSEFATWDELVGPNIDAAANVFHAAALAGVERIVFASSNHVMSGYRAIDDMILTVDAPPKPGNAYGGAKLMAERLGKSLSGVFDLNFVALRLGWVQPGSNLPDTLPDAWSRGLWLSDGDLVRLFNRAVEADLGDRSFVVVNGVSNNHGTRWDLAGSFEAIGFTPEDDSFADETDHPGPRSLG